ncbi:hypothetical protein [Syntrophotalea acetylenica]|uniref:Uncharacterized protein n=1 Tax=Syntrophotalea acetylenica TaxID=29542 RepID=A0A1L3GE36_SYNAC|nr:hypothetical protein [Syntrophotalea acetylenica]APG24089.1 hypothetical protein A7E75_02875 [Syntrophotalea acetylenica]APG44671.1 hypothetical protein A6070_11500 [Syntrophotalea acetylenica]
MPYKPCRFDRKDYLSDAQSFEAGNIANAETELCEFNEDAEDLAFELAYTRYRVAILEQFIKNATELGYITVPDQPDPARQMIFEILKA